MAMKPKTDAPAMAGPTEDNLAIHEPEDHLRWRGAAEEFLARLCVPDETLASQSRAFMRVLLMLRQVPEAEARAEADRSLAARRALRDEIRRRVALPEPAHWMDVAQRACRTRAILDDLAAHDWIPQRPATTWSMPAEAAKPQAQRKGRMAAVAEILKGVAL